MKNALLLFIFFVSNTLVVIINYILCVEIISDQEIMEKIYKENIDIEVEGNTWIIDAVCLKPDYYQKVLICRQILEAIQLEFDTSKYRESDEWRCEIKNVNVSNDVFLDTLLKCPVKKENLTESYYISFSRYCNDDKSKIEVFGYTNTGMSPLHVMQINLTDSEEADQAKQDTVFAIHKYFKDVKIVLDKI